MFKISVIIPTYKPQAYLWECLESLTSQTFSKDDFEVILVLNGCVEPYKSKIEQYIVEKMQGVNVNFIHTEVGGVSNARNIALDQVKGCFITFLDDDDFVSPKFLDLLYKSANEETIALCYPYAFNDGNLVEQLPYRLTNVYEQLYKKKNWRVSSKARSFFSGPCMKLIPVHMIRERRFDVRFKNGEDSLFMFLISDSFKYVNFTSKEAVYYRRNRQGSAIFQQRSKKDRLRNSCAMLTEYLKIYIRGGYSVLFFLTRFLAEMKCITMDLLGLRR